jgi:hypothetical protein
MAQQATQFCVGLKDKPGMLAELCGALRRANVSIEALFVSIDDEGCWVNMVAAPAPAAERALCDGSYDFFKEQVLTLEGQNRPGVLEDIARDLAGAGVNINYVYGASGQGPRFVLVLNVSDLQRAEDVLA